MSEFCFSTGDPAGHVLVVDDEAYNRELLYGVLVDLNYQVTEAVNGEQALRQVTDCPPDVILLDIMMPGMDGFEVCRRLKENPVTAPIPILLVTALSDRKDRLRGIDAGANDFLTKPIDSEDVVLRVRNAVYTRQLFDRLQDSYQQLKELEALRDNLMHMIVHDMRSPLTGISGYLQLLQMDLEEQENEQSLGHVNDALSNTQELIEMVSTVLDVSRMEAEEMPVNRSECNLHEVMEHAIDSVHVMMLSGHVLYHAPPAPVCLSCDQDLVRRILINLMTNAIKFTPSGGEVQVEVEETGAHVRVAVTDTGPGIPPEYHEKIFEKFGQAETREHGKYSTGLGLTFCKLAVEAHRGTIGVDSEVGKGSTFWFILPTNHG